MNNHATVEKPLSDGHLKKLEKIQKENEKIRLMAKLINSIPVRKRDEDS